MKHDTLGARPRNSNSSHPSFIDGGQKAIHTIPLSDGDFYIVSDDDFVELQKSFPNLDVRFEISNLEAWLSLNAKRRKMTHEMGPFIHEWLTYSSKHMKSPARKGGNHV